MECPGCKANLEIDQDNLIAFCPYCGKKLLYDSNGMSYVLTEREKTKRASINHDFELEKIKTEHEEKRKDELHDTLMIFLPFLIFAIIYFFCKFVIYN